MFEIVTVGRGGGGGRAGLAFVVAAFKVRSPEQAPGSTGLLGQHTMGNSSNLRLRRRVGNLAGRSSRRRLTCTLAYRRRYREAGELTLHPLMELPLPHRRTASLHSPSISPSCRKFHPLSRPAVSEIVALSCVATLAAIVRNAGGVTAGSRTKRCTGRQKAFKNSELLDAGGFGKVYRGVLRRSGDAVAPSSGSRLGLAGVPDMVVVRDNISRLATGWKNNLT